VKKIHQFLSSIKGDTQKRKLVPFLPHGVLTESDLLALVGRQYEGEQCEHGDEGARNDEVEAVVESSTADVDAERYVDVPMCCR